MAGGGRVRGRAGDAVRGLQHHPVPDLHPAGQPHFHGQGLCHRRIPGRRHRGQRRGQELRRRGAGGDALRRCGRGLAVVDQQDVEPLQPGGHGPEPVPALAAIGADGPAGERLGARPGGGRGRGLRHHHLHRHGRLHAQFQRDHPHAAEGAGRYRRCRRLHADQAPGAGPPRRADLRRTARPDHLRSGDLRL